MKKKNLKKNLKKKKKAEIKTDDGLMDCWICLLGLVLLQKGEAAK